MSQHKAQGMRCFRIDRVFPGVGRIAVTSGTDSVAELKKREAVLTELADLGKLDILKAIKEHRLTVGEVYAAQRTGTLGFSAASAERQQDLKAALVAWLPRSARNEETRKFYRSKADALLRLLPAVTTVEDLKRVNWHRLRQTWPHSPATWNRVRATLSAFLSSLARGSKRDPFRVEVMAYYPTMQEDAGRVPDLAVEDFWRLVEVTDEPFQSALVTTLALGLRQGELFRLRELDLLPATRQVKINGKTGADTLKVEARWWPIVTDAVRKIEKGFVTRSALRRAFEAARARIARPGLHLHDIRHCTAQYLVDAGATEPQVRAFMRHKTATMTARYTRQRLHEETAATLGAAMVPPHSWSHSARKRLGAGGR